MFSLCIMLTAVPIENDLRVENLFILIFWTFVSSKLWRIYRSILKEYNFQNFIQINLKILPMSAINFIIHTTYYKNVHLELMINIFITHGSQATETNKTYQIW